MAHFYITKTQRAVEDFKIRLGDLLAETGEKQESIAHDLGAGQSSFNNWLNLHSDRHMPAAIIPLLPEALRTGILRYLASQSQTRVDVDPNGMIEDEVTDLVEHMGEFVKQWRTDKTKKAKLSLMIEKMRKDLDKLEAEVEA